VPEITAQTMCQEMVTADLLEAKRLSLLKKHGYNVNIALE
jgi:GDPmannose 4,6-dehydratase